MAREYLRRMLTSAVRAAQQHYFDLEYPDQGAAGGPEPLGEAEVAFVAQRDSFYMATVTEDGWPYIQHRGGPRGFLVATLPSELVFADYGGNRQLISTGSVARHSRVSLFLMDYPNRARLKILGEATVLDAREHAELVDATAPEGGHAAPPERFFRIAVQAFDWNCSKFISERYTVAEVEAHIAHLNERIRQLEAELEASP